VQQAVHGVEDVVLGDRGADRLLVQLGDGVGDVVDAAVAVLVDGAGIRPEVEPAVVGVGLPVGPAGEELRRVQEVQVRKQIGHEWCELEVRRRTGEHNAEVLVARCRKHRRQLVAAFVEVSIEVDVLRLERPIATANHLAGNEVDSGAAREVVLESTTPRDTARVCVDERIRSLLPIEVSALFAEYRIVVDLRVVKVDHATDVRLDRAE